MLIIQCKIKSSKNKQNYLNKISFENVFEIKNFSDGYLKIMELNQFKLLCHLSLKFKSANDEILKNYLASKLSKFCSENDELRIKGIF